MAVTDDRWLDAQYSVLGSALISPEVVPKVVSETSDRDYSGACLTVYRVIRKLFLAGTAVDPVSVAGALGNNYRDFLVQLMEITPTAANIDHYIALCREQARVITVRELARKMTEVDTSDKMRELLEEATGLMVDKPSLKISTMSDSLRSFMDRHTKEVKYLTWPVRELNDRIYAELGDLIIFGGYPSTGKSAWALQCAWHWAKDYKVGFFSLETSSEKLFDRQMAAVVQVSMDEIKRNDIQREGWDKICAMTPDIVARNLELIPAAGMTPADVRAVTMMQGYQIIFVDYLQLLQGPGENRTAQVTGISIALHTLAQSMGVTVVALSQLSRQGQQGKNAPPDMSALRESGQIEQDADVVMMLSLEDKDNPAGNRELRIRKNKEGTCPNILLSFDGKHQTFAKAQGDVLGKLVADGKRAKRKNQQPAPEPGQMTMLPDDTPVPFEN
ncbi:MAG: replicative DNA helicase [Faecousia sp.]